MTKTKKNKSMIKRILAFLGAGVCAIACMLCCFSGVENRQNVYADSLSVNLFNALDFENTSTVTYSMGSNTFTYTINETMVSGETSFEVMPFGYLDAGTYTVSFQSTTSLVDNEDGNTLFIIGSLNENGAYESQITQSIQLAGYNTITFTLTERLNVGMLWYYKRGWIAGDTPAGNKTLKNIQLEYGSVATNYTPYVSDTFSSGNTYIPISMYSNNSLVSDLENFVLFNVNFKIKNGVGAFSGQYFLQSISLNIFNADIGVDTDSCTSSVNLTSFSNGFVSFGDLFVSGGSSYYYKIYYSFSSISNTGVVTMGLPVKSVLNMELSNDNTCITTSITFYDSKNNYVLFKLDCLSSLISTNTQIVENYCLKNYVNYYDNAFNFTDSEKYNQGYLNGESDGYTKGYSVGKNDGYNQGFSQGKNVGYNNGYNQGVSESNDYTFLGLISATIDAPITYFTSLFNFELLGVNLSAFLTGLFTLCVIITIVRLVLGGK